MRVMAVDPGEARVGLAVSDETETLATPLVVLRGGPGAEARIADAARDSGVGRIVVGLAVNLDGSEGEGAGRARALADGLGGLTGLPVELWDERYTTDLAQRLRRDSSPAARGGGPGGGHKARRPGRSRRPLPDDAAAAAVLLQSYLDRREGVGARA
jgi:putative Holliday junction resolvase